MRMGRIPIFLVVCVVVLLLNSPAGLCRRCYYKRIFSFGDSIIDTGNFAYATGKNMTTTAVNELPYGMTYFKRPTGRVSDGRVLVDFYAQALGLPLLPPSMPEEGSGLFPTGANFAYLGATALPPSYYKRRFNVQMTAASHLGMQLDSFKRVLARIAPGADATRSLLAESLIIMGEIGGNDYNYWLLAGDHRRRRRRHTPLRYVPDVVRRVAAAVQDVIDLGAAAVLVPGNFPIGCVPGYLGALRSNDTADYDDDDCLIWYNRFSRKHNALLERKVRRLRSRNPAVTIIFADYFGAAMQFVRNPKKYGIDDPLVACCGGGGLYHTTGKGCNKNTTLWGKPANFASWDGIHMTEKAYSVISDGVLNGPFADPPLLSTC